jgi:hypothetical protein
MNDHECMCDVPCTVCGTLYFDDITLEERTDCEHIIPLPEWHEYLTDAQVAQMNQDVAPVTERSEVAPSDVLRDPRVKSDTGNSDLEDE